LTKKKAATPAASGKQRRGKQSGAGSAESEPGPASKIIDLKGLSGEEALKLALATPWPAEKRKAAGPDVDSEPAGSG